MAFKQYTKCIEAADFSSRTRYITIASLLAGTPAAMIAIAAGHPACLLIAAEVTALAGLVAYYHNWLYHRLICLGGDEDCLAAIVSISEPAGIGFPNFLDRDTDYSINLLLENTEYGGVDSTIEELQPVAEQVMPYGRLIAGQPSVTAIGLKTEGHLAEDKTTGRKAATLHAEFEGDGNYVMLKASEVLLAFAIYSLIACIFLPWPADIILGLINLLLGLLGLLLGTLIGKLGEGDPSDVNAGDITDNTHDGIGADIVYVQGTWVFDPLHQGYNEIHPVKICMKMGTWDGDWGTPDVILRLRRGFDVAQSPDTLTNQALPEHQWLVHPQLDGCSRQIIL